MNCNYCGKPAQWVENKEIYGRNYGKSYMMWICWPCNAYVGCHNNTKAPLGKLANKALREARMKAHSVIDPLWKSHRYKRSTVYKRLSEAFGYTVHIGNSDEKECEDIIKTAEMIFSPPLLGLKK